MLENTKIVDIIFKFVLCFIVAGTCAAHAEQTNDLPQPIEDIEPPVGGKELVVFNEMMGVVEEATTIATKTKMNAEWVPGMVTGLRGSDSESRGVHTIKEALNLIPGVSYLDVMQTVSIRGVTAFASGKVKYLLNGTPFNDTLYGYGGGIALHMLPIEMVERLEVIRGPGSAIYGEHAFNGVINIITRKEGQQLFARHGSFETYAGGGLVSYAQGDWSMSLALAGLKSEGDTIISGPDALYGMEQEDISYAPGPSNEKVKSETAIFVLTHKKSSLMVQRINSGIGNAFGVWSIAPILTSPDKRIVIEDKVWQAEAKHIFKPAKYHTMEFKAGWMQYILDVDKQQWAPPGFLDIYDNGMVASFLAEEQKYYASLFVEWSGWKEHKLSLGLDYSTVQLKDAWFLSNFDAAETMAPLPQMQMFTGENSWILSEPAKRRLHSVMVQDQWEITNHLTSTIGLRFDGYSDVGSNLSPRLALVYRLKDQHIFKAQFSSAFRPPSFLELYSNNFFIQPNLDIAPETIRTFELGYVFKNRKTVGRMTLFHSEMEDMINIGSNAEGVGQFQNIVDVDLDGVELELQTRLTPTLKLDTNLSFVTTENKVTGEELPDASSWLGNAGLLFQPLPDYLINFQTRYVGQRHRDSDDPRDKLSSHTTVNVTGTVFNLGFNGLIFRVGAKNLFDADVREPSPLIKGEQVFPSYPEDYPRSGRELWTTLKYVY